MLICYLLMKIVNIVVKYKGWVSLQSGLYYEEYVRKGKILTRFNINMYFWQLLIWVIVVTIV